MESTGTSFWKFFLRRMQAGTVFTGIGITPPLYDRILGHSLRYRTFFRRKVTLYATHILYACMKKITGRYIKCYHQQKK
jgi:hypothetical protein